jgi:hypothetical protein
MNPARWAWAATLATGLSLLGACSTVAPSRYAVSAENVVQLKRLPAGRWRMGTITPPPEYSGRCRLAAPIDGPDGLSIPQYIERAFNDEFKLAGVHADAAPAITGRLQRLSFDSFAGLGRGRWLIELTLRGTDGREMTVTQQHEFSVGFDGLAACEQTARALQPAVQDLIRQAIAQPTFATLAR